jgi:hypothetical protein
MLVQSKKILNTDNTMRILTTRIKFNRMKELIKFYKRLEKAQEYMRITIMSKAE